MQLEAAIATRKVIPSMTEDFFAYNCRDRALGYFMILLVW